MKTHTPVPWNIGKDGDIWAENNTHCIHLIPDTLNAENNAAFIVRACNAHDDLVELLTDILYHLEDGKDLHGGARIFAENSPAAVVIKEALAKARQ